MQGNFVARFMVADVPNANNPDIESNRLSIPTKNVFLEAQLHDET